MASKMIVKVSSKKTDTGEVYEGTVSISGLRPTKLQKPDGVTQYPTKQACLSSARGLAKRLGCECVVDEPLQKAAKAKTTTTSSRSATPKRSATSKSSCDATKSNLITPPWLKTTTP